MSEQRHHQPEYDRSGGIILLSGLSGVGKSTLIHDALAEYPEQLHYLKDFTTRPKRATDTDTEYSFVNDEEFDRQRDLAEDWQEGSVYGNRYGHDTAAFRELMKIGNFFVGCCYPSLEDAQSLDAHYGPSAITLVHVELPYDTRAERLISQRGAEGRARLEKDATWNMSEDYRNRIDFLFNSNRARAENRIAFNALLSQIFRNSRNKGL